MIVGLRVSNYKALRDVQGMALGPFHVLVGPNGSGKSTFLDVLDFVRDCLHNGPRQAVENRAPEFRDLTFMRQGGAILIDLWIDLQSSSSTKDHLLLYRLGIEYDHYFGIRVTAEELSRLPRTEFHYPTSAEQHTTNWIDVMRRLVGRRGEYYREDVNSIDLFGFDTAKLSLAMTPEDEGRYPTANAVKRFLMRGVRAIQLNSQAMRRPCPALSQTELALDGSNLAKVVGRLRQASHNTNGARPTVDPLRAWVDHLRYALPDLADIGWGRREADNAEYIVLKYANGLECPSWLASDGTLRMLALTLPAFLPPTPGIYMVEEPENGVHPMALEIIIQSLSSIPDAQVLVATHSPLVVAQVGREPLLCFARDETGTTITRGADHPALNEWDGTPDLATVFAAGILG